jgi:hypothetical protein
MDSRHDHRPDDDLDAPPMPTEAELRAMMDESDADVAAGRTVPLAEVLSDLDAAIERIEVRRRARRA